MTLTPCEIRMVIALTFGCATLLGQPAQALTDSEVRELAMAMVKAHIAWGARLSSPSAVLTLKETARDQGRISYRLYAEGLPGHHVYSLVQWPITQKEPGVVLPGVTFDKSGLAVCAGKPGTCGDPAKPDDPIDLQTSPVKGEPLRFAVVAEDAPDIRAAVKTVPIPNFGEDNGCRINAVLLMPHAELIWLEASNFPPNTALSVIQDSEGEVQKAQPKTDSVGKYGWAIMPTKAGLKTGIIKIQAQAPGCSPQVAVRWGSGGQ